MNMNLTTLTAAVFFLLGLFPQLMVGQDAGAIQVELKQTDSGWQLFRDGKPYYINGVGCDGPMGDLATTGANSLRTWHFNEDSRKYLDAAHAKNLSVTVGIWLGHERHGVNYQDYDSMAKQIDMVMECVKELKDHPAVLMWGVGNEMEGEGANPAVWSHIEHLASAIKKIDSAHPVMTVIAEIGGRKLEAIHKFCPSVDVIGINSYGGGPSLSQRYTDSGSTKPYVVTEFGPVGTWEVSKNNIDAILEPSSKDKADHYAKSYRSFKADSKNCLGSYAFLWGYKQEATATWFGMLLPNGNRTASVDAMMELWTGQRPKNRCPEITKFQLKGKNEVELGETVSFEMAAMDVDGDPVNVEWVMTDESSNYVTGGDFQAAPTTYQKNIIKSDKTSAQIKMPESGGLYRIYAYVDDGKKGGAVANLPVRVRGPVKIKPAMKADLPVVIFDEKMHEEKYTPSGYMGSHDSLKLVADCEILPKAGKTCLKIDYDRGDEWAGVVWQSPVNDWGAVDGGFDLTGGTKLTFWARGEKGGEESKFGVGLIGREQPYFDTAKKEIAVKLTDQWQQFTIDLSGQDLQRIKTGFYFSLAGQGEPLTFYLDDIKFE
jgi:hypothetical protein